MFHDECFEQCICREVHVAAMSWCGIDQGGDSGVGLWAKAKEGGESAGCAAVEEQVAMA
jgi:hypothetical protein